MPNPFEGVRAALFDMDGTLVETNIDFARMRREMLALGGDHAVPVEEIRGLDILAIVDRVTGCVRDVSGEAAARRVRRKAYEQLEQIELTHCHNAQPVAGALELLDALRAAGVKIGIVTRSCAKAVRICLARTGVWADVLLTRDDVVNAKPHPAHVLEAVEILGIPPEEAIMVGDHSMDIEGGKAAGARTVGFLRPDRAEDFFEEVRPDLVIRDLRELLPYVERLRK